MCKHFISIIILLLLTSNWLYGQINNAFCIAVFANHSEPIGGLSNWFKSTENILVSAGIQQNSEWTYEGTIEYTRYEDENLSGYAKEKLILSLEHIGAMFSAKYNFVENVSLRPYLGFSLGPHYWKGIRGKIQADSALSVPFIQEKVLEEWNWGFKVALGIDYTIVDFIQLDVNAGYRLIIGDLWPTMQQYVELDGVSGFQSLNLAAGIRILIK